jgi:lipopolysaccharide/colanic/teichoic acid biosynthesis glycosyltransferase
MSHVTEAAAEPVGAAYGSSRGGGLYARVLKRWLDVALVLAAAPLALPLVLALAFLVRRDGGPAFFLQERVGRGGRVFRILKLRSMVVDAEARLAAHLDADPALRAEWAANQKLRNDPRITAVGRFLRRSSLDELPQLWNVLRGEMSVVGPRPMLPEQRGLYPGRAYFRMRPGITGPWQVSDRNAVSFADRARFDADYAGRMSLLTDVVIMLLTVRAMLRGTGC